jgi:hypothetical protein
MMIYRFTRKFLKYSSCHTITFILNKCVPPKGLGAGLSSEPVAFQVTAATPTIGLPLSLLRVVKRAEPTWLKLNWHDLTRLILEVLVSW